MCKEAWAFTLFTHDWQKSYAWTWCPLTSFKKYYYKKFQAYVEVEETITTNTHKIKYLMKFCRICSYPSFPLLQHVKAGPTYSVLCWCCWLGPWGCTVRWHFSNCRGHPEGALKASPLPTGVCVKEGVLCAGPEQVHCHHPKLSEGRRGSGNTVEIRNTFVI